MAKDVIVRMKANTADYDKNMAKAKKSLEQFGEQNLTLGGVMSKSTAALVKAGAAMLSLNAAMEVGKKVIGGSQSATDAFGRTMEVSSRLVDGFFESISRGNFSSFVAGLKDVITNARQAYDALDALSTFEAFQTKETTEFGKRREQYRANIRMGVNVEEAKKGLKELEAEERAFYLSGARTAKEAANAKLAELTQSQLGKGWVKPYLDMGAGGQDAAMKEYERLKKAHGKDVTTLKPGSFSFGSVAAETKTVWDDADIGKKANALLNYAQLADEQLNEVNGLYAKSANYEQQYWNHVASDQRILNYGSRGGGGGGGDKKPKGVESQIDPITVPVVFGTTESMNSLKERLAQYQAAIDAATTPQALADAEAGKAHTEALIEAQPTALQLGLPAETVAGVQEQMQSLRDSLQAQMDEDAIQLKVELGEAAAKGGEAVVKNGEKSKQSWSQAAQTINYAGQALSNTGSKELNVAGIIMQAIANIALGFAMASANSAKTGVLGWIVATVAGLATMTATIASIKSATAGGFAEGGVVPGNSYSGDRLIAMVNSGEVIMNRRQQQNALAMMETSPIVSVASGESATARTSISGEQLVTVINAYGRRSGRGEILR